MQSSDGGYAVTGYTTSFGAGSNDVFVVKFDSNGNLSWNKTWGGAGNDSAHSIIQSRDGGYVLSGSTDSFGSGSADAFIAKFDSSGNLSWNKTWGGSVGDGAINLIQVFDDGYIITGDTGSYGSGSGDAFIAKFDSNGNLSWNKTWGGSENDLAIGISGLSDGYIVTGYAGSYSAGGNDAFMLKYDLNGNLIWNKLLGGAGSEAFYGSILTSDSSYLTAGYMSSYGAGGNDMFFAKYDTNGNLLWNKTWGGTGYDVSATFRGLSQLSDGGYAAIGSSSSYSAGGNDVIIMKLKSDGTINNCSSPMCQTPTATVTTPSATITTPSASVSSPAATVTSPTATVTTPTVTVTTVVAP